jgi:glycosyltransferase involved in cell wall biosynthesis
LSSLSRVTILITSFLRPGYLSDCLDGIKRNLPECPVVVVDDGGLIGEGIISMPFDSGLSAKRNRGIAATKTPYVLMGSDDFDFSTEEARKGIERMVEVLDNDSMIEVAGGHVNGEVYEGNLIVVPGQYIAQTKLAISPTGITPCDLVVNYFVARTESIRPYPWDERMKIGGEHGDWFLTLKDNGVRVAAISDVNITTMPYNRAKEDPRYATFRGRAKGLGHRIFLRKRGVSEFYGSASIPPEPLKLPKFVVAVVACHKNQKKIEELRKTWLQSMYKMDYKIFYGRGATREPLSDEVFLDVDDGYLGLPEKVKAIYQWVLDNGYDYVCKVDDDTYVEVPRLVTAGWQQHDYTGRENCGGNPSWASGGAYWLSKRAMQLVSESRLTSDTAEDRWVATILHKQGINVYNDLRYSLIIYHQPDWTSAVTACICHPNATMLTIAEGFDTGYSSMAVPPYPNSPPYVPSKILFPPSNEWKKTFLEDKVKSLFQRFRYVVATIPGSSHHKALCKIYPHHMEEKVETPEGLRVIFVVDR